MKDHELTQGNLLYIYMADKMSDGRMKLRRMSITEEDIEDIKNFLDPKFMQLADWMQEEFLVDKRNEYNEVHKRMFGASMAAIENYFPLNTCQRKTGRCGRGGRYDRHRPACNLYWQYHQAQTQQSRP